MTVDWAEERVYVGSADGRIYQVELMDQQSNQQQQHHHQYEDQSDDEDEGEGEKEPGRHQRRRRMTKFLGHEKSEKRRGDYLTISNPCILSSAV